MNILSLETSTKTFSLAVSNGAKIIRFRNHKSTAVLEDSIMPAINSILASAKIPFTKLDAFAVGLGPGSFTSLRIGLSTVKAFALATGKDVVGVCSLDITAQAAINLGETICVLSDARRNMVYSAVYIRTTPGISTGKIKRSMSATAKTNAQQGEKNSVKHAAQSTIKSACADVLELQGEYQLGDLASALKRAGNNAVFTGDALGIETIAQQIKKVYPKAVCAPAKLWLPQATHLAKLALARLNAGQPDDAVKLVPVYLYAPDCQVSKV